MDRYESRIEVLDEKKAAKKAMVGDPLPSLDPSWPGNDVDPQYAKNEKDAAAEKTLSNPKQTVAPETSMEFFDQLASLTRCLSSLTSSNQLGRRTAIDHAVPFFYS